MLIEDLIRLGRPLLGSGDFKAEDVLRFITGVEDVRLKNFYRHVFVVDVPTDEKPVASRRAHAAVRRNRPQRGQGGFRG